MIWIDLKLLRQLLCAYRTLSNPIRQGKANGQPEAGTQPATHDGIHQESGGVHAVAHIHADCSP